MSSSSNAVLDVRKLAAAVQLVASHRRISMREVAEETGLSSSTLTRISQGQKPDADALLTLLMWLGDGDLRSYVMPRDQAQTTPAT
jgi:transcriptional regulator with XRE-family HTH domain